VVLDERLPVRITGTFNRLSNLRSGECHGFLRLLLQPRADPG
jgi:hypothetical protein